MEIEQIKTLLDKVHTKINNIRNVDKLDQLLESYYYLLKCYDKLENEKIIKKVLDSYDILS